MSSVFDADVITLVEKIHWLGNAGFYIEGPDKMAVYIDPFKLKNHMPKADCILISHAHFDHCSASDVKKIFRDDTLLAGPAKVVMELPYKMKVTSPGEHIDFHGISIDAVPAYNPHKNFHPPSDENVGYLITMNGIKIYHAGDTDFIPEMENIKADIAMVPVGGMYTMDPREAAEAINLINPKIAIPMHFVDIQKKDDEVKEFQKYCKVEVVVKAQGK
ncbi:MAG: MBL fold metallo-hydrolase [Candidatus Omnitrophica bacterium]|nr:MBL fold metallo-hydrolase [Candidatus Omnitrophota bacterium]